MRRIIATCVLVGSVGVVAWGQEVPWQPSMKSMNDQAIRSANSGPLKWECFRKGILGDGLTIQEAKQILGVDPTITTQTITEEKVIPGKPTKRNTGCYDANQGSFTTPPKVVTYKVKVQVATWIVAAGTNRLGQPVTERWTARIEANNMLSHVSRE